MIKSSYNCTGMLIPPPIVPGDTIGIIAPAGDVRSQENVTQGVEILKSFGFNVAVPQNLWPGNGYFSDTDSNRAREFIAFLKDPQIKGLMAMRGGYGCLRILDQIDPKLLRKHPKYIIGFSDITVLHCGLCSRADIVSLHGPVLSSLSSATHTSMLQLLSCMKGEWKGHNKAPQCVCLQRGQSTEGRVVGGNLSSLTSLIGTPWDISWSGAIIFLEDINEPLYRIDRMLRQLLLAGKLDDVQGVLLGDFSVTEKDLNQPGLNAPTREVWKLITEIFAHRKQVPVWGNLPVGHHSQNMTLPVGAWCKMDCDNIVLHFEDHPETKEMGFDLKSH